MKTEVKYLSKNITAEVMTSDAVKKFQNKCRSWALKLQAYWFFSSWRTDMMESILHILLQFTKWWKWVGNMKDSIGLVTKSELLSKWRTTYSTRQLKPYSLTKDVLSFTPMLLPLICAKLKGRNRNGVEER